MKKQITEISVQQSSKLIGVLQFLVTSLICMPLAILAFLMTRKIEWLGIVFIPFAIWVVSYVFSFVLVWGYNIAAKSFGGLEYYTSEVEE